MRQGLNFLKAGDSNINFHKCTDADYDEFYPISESEKGLFNKFRSLYALYCIDAGQDMLIRGNSYMDYNALDIQMNPCFPNETAKTCLNSTL